MKKRERVYACKCGEFFYESAVELMEKYEIDCYCGRPTAQLFIFIDEMNENTYIVDCEDVKETLL